MGMPPFKCIPGFSTTHTSPLTVQLEAHASTMDATYRESYREWGNALSTLHDAVDAALASDACTAGRHVADGRARLATCNDGLTAFGAALVELRSDLFERGAEPSEPLIAREPFFSTLDYDGLYRQLAAQGAALPNRAFWDEVASRARDGGARGALRLLDRHVRELQSDLQLFVGGVEAAGRLSLRPMAEALHNNTSLAVSRVMTGYTRLLTTCGYLSILCEHASLAYDRSLQRPDETLAAG